MHERFLPMLETVRSQNPSSLTDDRLTGHGKLTEVDRYKLELPWPVPFADPAIYERPVVLDVFRAIVGNGRFRVVFLSLKQSVPGQRMPGLAFGWFS